MTLKFSMYSGFLITDDQESNVKAYRNRAYYAGNTTSYEASSPANIGLMIDEAGDHGDFTVEGYNEVMRMLGEPEFDQRMLPRAVSPTKSIYPYDEGIEKAAAYIAGLIHGREDVDDPTHPVWTGIEKEEYRDSYRRRARRVIELAQS